MADGTDSAMFLAALYLELCYNCITETVLPMECITDSKSLLEALRSNKPVREKRLRVELCGMKQMMELKQITDVRRCDSKYQLVDCLTKQGSSPMMLLRSLEEGLLPRWIICLMFSLIESLLREASYHI